MEEHKLLNSLLLSLIPMDVGTEFDKWPQMDAYSPILLLWMKNVTMEISEEMTVVQLIVRLKQALTGFTFVLKTLNDCLSVMLAGMVTLFLSMNLVMTLTMKILMVASQTVK